MSVCKCSFCGAAALRGSRSGDAPTFVRPDRTQRAASGVASACVLRAEAVRGPGKGPECCANCAAPEHTADGTPAFSARADTPPYTSSGRDAQRLTGCKAHYSYNRTTILTNRTHMQIT